MLSLSPISVQKQLTTTKPSSPKQVGVGYIKMIWILMEHYDFTYSMIYKRGQTKHMELCGKIK